VTLEFEPVSDLTGSGEAKSNIDLLARLFPDAVVDGTVDVDVLRDLLGDNAALNSAEAFGLRWPGMAEARRLSTLPPTGTLLPKHEESVDWESTRNLVIEGDNLEVLRLLRRGYTNKVDVIYIDPPYNTGNDFVYDDKRTTSRAEHEAVAGQRDDEGVLQVGEGSDRAQDRKAGASLHTKWLSMMYPRLLVAHHLLKETGVIIVAIDDTEHARLKLLMDRVFGAENFIANVTWQGAVKSDARFIGGGHDYMLVYSRNVHSLIAAGMKWRFPKEGLDEVLERGASFWEESGHDADKATRMLSKWWSQNKGRFDPGLADNVKVDNDGTVIKVDNISWPGGGGPRYDVLHPVTRKPVVVPGRGWIYSDPRKMQREIDEGRILFGKDHTSGIRRKIPLARMTHQAIRPSFYRDRRAATKNLAKLFDGAAPFDFPKDAEVIGRWIHVVTGENPDALVLDFFAGSGSTGHAVMDLNAADGGNRRYILVQLDESVEKDGYNTIADITRERLRRAGKQIALKLTFDAANIDTGFRSYLLASSNVKAWDGTAEQLDLFGAVDNLKAGRTTDDLLVETMLRQGVDLTTPLEKREVAGSTLYNLAGALFAYFGTDISVECANEVAKALVAWHDEDPGDASTTVVVRDSGFVDAAAKLNFAAALEQAGFTTLRSI
jgi:adenine-specific DNA-methyltransferase